MANSTRETFVEQLKSHLQGLREKAANEFSKKNFNKELNGLANDPVYQKFHLANADYAFIRFMGRMSISIGRRLGEIYDKILRAAAQTRFGLTKQDVVIKLNRLELDINIPFDKLKQRDLQHVKRVIHKHLKSSHAKYASLGIEIRYNFNPNDSSRLRKDCDMGAHLKKKQARPLYLVFADNSPRLKDAVARLKRAGWEFLIGQPAHDFMTELVGFDFSQELRKSAVSKLVESQIRGLMEDIKNSYAAAQSTFMSSTTKN